MSNGLQPSVPAKVEHTVETGTHGQASGICLRDSECSECLSFYVFDLSKFSIVLFFRLTEEPVHAVRYTWRDVYVLECSEVRETDLEIMGHSVLELVHKSRLAELRCLEADLVLERCVVSERELLVPFLLADSLFLLERIESVH